MGRPQCPGEHQRVAQQPVRGERVDGGEPVGSRGHLVDEPQAPVGARRHVEGGGEAGVRVLPGAPEVAGDAGQRAGGGRLRPAVGGERDRDDVPVVPGVAGRANGGGERRSESVVPAGERLAVAPRDPLRHVSVLSWLGKGSV